MNISVIIPTYNDAHILQRCLDCLAEQEDKSFEIIIVDDGSTDNTQGMLFKWQELHKDISLLILKQENKKQGAARNFGVKYATGDIIIFIGADILVSKHWIAEHKKFHTQFPDEKSMALGFMTWSKELASDRFRKWLESSGTMLSYKGLTDYKQTDYWHFYTGNISLKKSFFLKHQFNEDFKQYGFEDIMLGVELLEDGGKLYYIENARAYHHHALTKNDLFPKRMREIGKSAVHFQNMYPCIPVLPQGLKYFIFSLLSFNIVIKMLSFLKKEWGWYAESKKYYLQGIQAGTKF